MKTPEEIKLAMELCTSTACTDEKRCPYGKLDNCADVMTEDGLAYIKQLESNASQVSNALCDKENATLEEMLEAVSQLKQKVNDMDFACLKLLRKTDKLILDLAEQKGKVEWAHKRMLKLTIERNNLLQQLKEKEDT